MNQSISPPHQSVILLHSFVDRLFSSTIFSFPRFILWVSPYLLRISFSNTVLMINNYGTHNIINKIPPTARRSLLACNRPTCRNSTLFCRRERTHSHSLLRQQLACFHVDHRSSSCNLQQQQKQQLDNNNNT